MLQREGFRGSEGKQAPGSTWTRLADQWGELEEGWPDRGAVRVVSQGVDSLLGFYCGK